MYTHTHPVDQSGLVRYDFQTGQFSPVFASLYEPQKLDDSPVFHRFIRKKKKRSITDRSGPVSIFLYSYQLCYATFVSF
jgi:hypothetical protein